MPYNFYKLPSRRDSKILGKWARYPKDVLPMWVADADFPVASQIQQALYKQVEQGVLGYELPTKSFLGIIAARFLCNAEKGYLIQTPVYNEFQDTEHKTGVPQRTAPLKKKVSGSRISYEVDFETFEHQAKRAGMSLLCHPHNPVGRIYSRSELKRMAEICIDNNVTIVSDEIHSELLLGGASFIPMASLSREVAKHTITLVSASKAFNVPGLSSAFAIIPDEKRRKQFSEIGVGMSYEISTPGLTAARVAFSGKADVWLRELCRYLTGNRDFVVDYVEKNLPGIRVTKPDATYLIWLDCSELALKPSPFEFLLKEAKVALSDGGKFGTGNEQFVRLNFGTSRRLVEQGLRRIHKALDKM